MCLTIGTNTYASLEDIKAFLLLHPYGTLLSVLTDDTYIRYLIASFKNFRNLKWETDPNVLTVAEDWAIEAQCFELVALYVILSDVDYLVRESLQLQGVAKFTFDKQHEEFQRKKKYGGLHSKDAFDIVKPYLLRAPNQVFQTI